MRRTLLLVTLAMIATISCHSAHADNSTPTTPPPTPPTPTKPSINCASKDAAPSTLAGQDHNIQANIDVGQKSSDANAKALADEAAVAQKAPNWECGGLILPFKFELTGKEDILAAPVGALYVGRRLPFWNDYIGSATYLVAFVGYTTNFTTQKSTTGTSAQSSPNMGVTYGGGFSFGIHQNDVRIGTVVGFDHVSSSANYQYNDKPWLSIYIGSNF